MKITRRTAVTAMISATALPLLGGSRAFAQKTIPLTIASSHPLIIPWVGPLKTVIVDKSNALLEERGSDYRIDWTEAFGGTLYNFNQTLEAVTTQLTDMGWIGSLFEPASLPLQNIMYSTPFVTQTVAQAINTMNLLNAEQPAMKAEWAKYDVRFFGSCCSDGYSLYTKKPIEKLSDLEGLKILGGVSLAPWIEPLGASLVATGIPQMYSQVQTGVGDGVLLISTGAYPLKLHEVAPYVTRVDTGPLTFGGFEWELGPLTSGGSLLDTGRLILVVGASIATSLLSMLFTRTPDPASLVPFYEKVRPVGAWGPVRALAGVKAPEGEGTAALIGIFGGLGLIYGSMFTLGNFFLDHNLQAGVSLAFAVCGGLAVKSAIARLDLLRAAE